MTGRIRILKHYIYFGLKLYLWNIYIAITITGTECVFVDFEYDWCKHSNCHTRAILTRQITIDINLIELC